MQNLNYFMMKINNKNKSKCAGNGHESRRSTPDAQNFPKNNFDSNMQRNLL